MRQEVEGQVIRIEAGFAEVGFTRAWRVHKILRAERYSKGHGVEMTIFLNTLEDLGLGSSEPNNGLVDLGASLVALRPPVYP